jgi:hypothetical protein
MSNERTMYLWVGIIVLIAVWVVYSYISGGGIPDAILQMANRGQE